MRRRFVFFLLFFPAVTLPVFAYLGWRLCSGALDWALLALPFLSVLSFPLQVRARSGGRRSSRALRLASRATYLSMGLVSFLLVAAVARDFLGLVFHRWAEPRAAVGLAFAMLAAGSFTGFFGPRVRRLELRFANLPPALRGLRIVQLSDLHLSSHIGRRYVERVARKVVAAMPDLIALTGDIGDGSVPELRAEIEALRPLAGAAPVVYVPGNHEVYWNFPAWAQAFRDLGMKVLLNEGSVVKLRGEELFVGGLTDPACEALGLAPDLAAAARGGEGKALRILLSHRPDPAEAAAQAGFDLQLSGHTHGGQFFPWTVVAALVHRYSLGLYRVGEMWVYVSAGTGSWGPRIRLGTRAEITLIELACLPGLPNPKPPPLYREQVP